MPGGGYVKRPAVRIRGKKNPGADAARLNCSFFVYFVVQILLVIGLRAKLAPCASVLSETKNLFGLNIHLETVGQL